MWNQWTLRNKLSQLPSLCVPTILCAHPFRTFVFVIDFFFLMCMDVPFVCACAPQLCSAWRDQNKMSAPLEFKLQTGMSIWVLKIEPSPLEEHRCDISCWGICSGHCHCLLISRLFHLLKKNLGYPRQFSPHNSYWLLNGKNYWALLKKSYPPDE